MTYNLGENSVINDKATGLFNAFMSGGAALGPIFGGILTDYIGYRNCNDSMAIFATIFTSAFLIFNMEKSDFAWYNRQ